MEDKKYYKKEAIKKRVSARIRKPPSSVIEKLQQAASRLKTRRPQQ